MSEDEVREQLSRATPMQVMEYRAKCMRKASALKRKRERDIAKQGWSCGSDYLLLQNCLKAIALCDEILQQMPTDGFPPVF